MNLELSGSEPVSASAARRLRFGSSRASVPKPRKSAVKKSVTGIVSVEIALLAIGLLGGMHMLFFAGRLSDARGWVQDIASEAARVASQAQDGTDAQKRVADFLKSSRSTSGRSTSGTSTSSTPKSSTPKSSTSGNTAGTTSSKSNEVCSKPRATVDISAFSRGGSVSVKVRCSVQLADLALVRIPGIFTLEAEAAEVIDVLRSGS